jgi:hypothetical protein
LAADAACPIQELLLLPNGVAHVSQDGMGGYPILDLNIRQPGT